MSFFTSSSGGLDDELVVVVDGSSVLIAVRLFLGLLPEEAMVCSVGFESLLVALLTLAQSGLVVR